MQHPDVVLFVVAAGIVAFVSLYAEAIDRRFFGGKIFKGK